MLPSGNPVTTGTPISSSDHNNTMSDIANGLTQSLSKDGQTTPVASLPMGGYRHTGVGDGTAADNYATVKQVQGALTTHLTGIAGTADAITGNATPNPSAYVAGQRFTFVAASANTGAVTLNVSGLGAVAVTRNGSFPLVAGEIQTGAITTVTYDGTRFQVSNNTRDIPGGTVLAFFQAFAPIGWTQIATHNNKAMRIVSGAGGGSGGSVAFTTAFVSQAVSGTVGNTTLNSSQVPYHDHTFPLNDNETGADPVATRGNGAYVANGTTSGFGGGGAHNHTFTGTAINLAVQYIDMILASKN